MLDVFTTWAPVQLSKADRGDDPNGAMTTARIGGIISTSAKDFQGDEIAQDGIDWSYFLKHGWFNWEHKNGPEHILGHPESVKRIEVNGQPATYVEGVLYTDKPLAKGVFETLNAIKSANVDRRIGLSVEGKVIARSGKTILKAQVLNTAICAHPINPEARVELIKGLSAMASAAGYQTPAGMPAGAAVSPLVPSSLSTQVSNAGFSASADISFADFTRIVRKTFGCSRQRARQIARVLFKTSKRS